MTLALVGNNLAVLVAAHELALRGRPVTLLSEGRPFGGHFGGLQAEGHDFDLGMVFMERPAHPEPSNDLGSYDARVRTDCARFTPRVVEFIASTSEGELRRVPTPQCVLGGTRRPDYMMSNRTEAFFQAPVPPPTDAAAAGRAHALHAARKAHGEAYDTLTYTQAAEHNHGPGLHARFFAPFARKLMGGADIPLLARYHRAAWLPLYYPETLAAALASRASLLPEYAFHLPASGSTSSWVQGLRSATLAMPGVTLVTQRVSAIQPRPAGGAVIALEGGGRVDATRLAIGTVSERMAAFAGQPAPAAAAASVRILLCVVPRAAIQDPAACLVVADEDRLPYRITDLDTAAGRDAPLHRVIAEAGVPAGGEDGADALDAAMLRDTAQLLGIVDPAAIRVVKAVTARHAVMLPTAHSLQAHAAALDGWRQAFPEAVLTGPLLAPGAGSMNDQVVQGLKIAAEWQ